MSIDVIHITGASGSGTTTLAKAICQQHRYTHFDTDDFFWIQTDPPFTHKRDVAERQSLLAKAIDTAKTCVISGSLTHWGDIFIPKFDLVLYLFAPTSIRVERLHKRELQQFGSRILPGGDMHAEHQAFLGWAAQYDEGDNSMRSALYHQEWLQCMPCPVITLDGTLCTNDMLLQLPL